MIRVTISKKEAKGISIIVKEAMFEGSSSNACAKAGVLIALGFVEGVTPEDIIDGKAEVTTLFEN